jgi:serine/threonine-protein kinase
MFGSVLPWSGGVPDSFDDLQAALPKRYRLERKLKRGGMGYIYLAHESQPDRQVAIKVLDPEVTIRLGRDRFLREVSLLSNLTHPHIVPVFAAGDAGGFLYFVMPYIEGETLSERIAREGHLQLGVSLRIAHEVADALAYAHQRGIVHRDIKPSNILLHEGHALVADFGIARAILAAGSEPITEVGIAVGTPAYMSPEQITGEETVDGRTDIYSLGCVLYEMLVGEPPFRGTDTRATMIKHVTDDPPPLKSKRDDIPAPVTALVHRALAKDPEDRFESARAMSQALREEGDPRSSWSGSVQTLPKARPGGAGWLKPAAFVAAFALLLIVLWPRLFPRDATLSATSRWVDSLAVFPLVNRTGDPRFDHIGHAITDLVVLSLGQLDSLKLSPPHSAEALQERGLTDRQLARELGVQHLVYGSVNPGTDGTIRVIVQHYNAARDALEPTQEWSLDPSNEARDEERIAARVAEHLSNEVLLTVARGSMQVPSLSPGHESQSMGKHFLARRTPEGIRSAIDLFQAAIGQDSAYAQAHADLSVAYSLSLTYRYDIGIDGYMTAGSALAHANHAIDLDSNLAAGWAARGYLGAIAGAPLDRVAEDFERASALNRNAADVASWSARVLLGQGRFDEALERAELAVIIDPASPSRRIAVALLELRRGEYDRAIEQAAVARDLEAGLVMPLAIAGRARVLSGKAIECDGMELGPHQGLRALCADAMGDVVRGAAVIDSVRALADVGQSGHPDFSAVLAAEDLAVYYAWKGDPTAALIWVRNAFRMSPSGVDTQIRESAFFDSVRSDSTFAAGLTTALNGRWARVTAARQAN